MFRFFISLFLFLSFSGFSIQDENPETVYENQTNSNVIVSLEEWRVPFDDTRSRDPYVAPDGTVFFAGHFNVETGDVHVIAVPTERARPYGIRMAPDKSRPWIALFGINKIATVDPETMKLTKIELPRDKIRPRRLDVTSDGVVW